MIENIGWNKEKKWIHPQYVEMLYSPIRDYNAEIAACDVRFIYEGSNIQYEQIEPVTNVHSSEEALEMLIKGVGFLAVAWNKLYHRRVLQGE